MDQDAIVLAVTGGTDPLALLHGARKLKDHLNALSLVKRAHIIADPGEQLTIAINSTLDVRHDLGPDTPTLRFHIDDAVAARYGISRVDVPRPFMVGPAVCPWANSTPKKIPFRW